MLLGPIAACGGAVAGPSDGGGGSVVTIGSNLSTTPLRMVSNGSSLYWTDGVSKAVSDMPVLGGTATVLAPNVHPEFIAADSALVYARRSDGLDAITIADGTSTLLSDAADTSNLAAVAVRGNTAYWVVASLGLAQKVLKSAPIPAGPSTVVATWQSGIPPALLALTEGASFMTPLGQGVVDIVALGGLDAGTPVTVTTPSPCDMLVCDDQNAYCVPQNGTVSAVAPDGTVTTLASVVGAKGCAVDDVALYLSTNPDTGAAIVKLSKQGGGQTTVLATDTVPVAAVAVDATSLYWATTDGHIRALAK
jgi:hypothetical protein